MSTDARKPVDNPVLLGYSEQMQSLTEELSQIRQAGLYRQLRSVSSQTGPKVCVEGRDMLMMASNDYLGLCSHPRLQECSCQAVRDWGAGSGAARLISGNVELFAALEDDLARFKSTEDALVFSTGYMANLGLLTSLGGAQDVIFSDALNHASIIDGCRLSRARVEVYPHADTAALEVMLKKSGGDRRRLIVTDGVFSMDGDIAPLPELAALAETYDALLIIDDAHATGVIGARGRGTLEYFGLEGCGRSVVMGTLGKALGCFGAFIAGSAELKEYLINRARSFIFTTALPPSVVAAAQEALKIVDDEPERRQRLHQNQAWFRSALQDMGYDIMAGTTQIVPVLVGDSGRAVQLAEELLAAGVFALAIRPPTVPPNAARLRMTVMATHTAEDLQLAVDALEKAGKHLGII